MSRRSKSRSGKKPNPGRRRGQQGMGKKKYGRRQAASPPTPQKRSKVKAEKKVARERTRTGGPERGEVGWEPSRAELRWDANYARAERLLGEEGADWWVGMSGRDKSFGAWLQTQRQLRKSGRLRADRESRLESIGFVWDTGKALWERDFSRLAEHIGCCGAGWLGRLPEEEPGLASWCAGQRRAFRRGELSAERIRRLEGLGFAWSYAEAVWDQRFAELCEVLREHPHGRIGEDNASAELVSWVVVQRRKRRSGEIDPERERRLDGIGFCWDGRRARYEERWEQQMLRLVDFQEKSGHADAGPDDDGKLFRWLKSQRQAWDSMPAERRIRLEELGVSRTTPPEQVRRSGVAGAEPNWAEFFRRAQEFRRRFGHLRVVRDAESNGFPGLLGFASKLRSGELEPDATQRAELDRLGFVWDVRAARAEAFFEERFAELCEYKREYGDCNVSQLSKTHRALGQWVNRMRLTRDELEPAQRERLDGIGFVWQLKKEWMEGQWELRFRELLDYKEANGHCLVPQVCPEWYTLSRWVSRMRQRKGELDEERIRRLDEIGFVWDAKGAEREAIEEMRYQDLATFVQANGHARVTRGNDPTGGALNAWIVRQRDKMKRGKMDPDLAGRLDGLGFVWVTGRGRPR